MSNDEAIKRLNDACVASRDLITKAAERNVESTSKTLEAAVSLARAARRSNSGTIKAVRPASITGEFEVLLKEAKTG